MNHLPPTLGDRIINIIRDSKGQTADEAHAIEQAKLSIPQPFRSGVYNHIAFEQSFDLSSWPRKSTWQHLEKQFIYQVAKNLHIV